MQTDKAMELLTSPNVWSCMPTALAMLLRKNVSVVFDTLGHDGSSIQWPDLPQPYCRRSFCLNEIIYVATKFGFGLVEVVNSCQYHPFGLDGDDLTVTVPDPNWEATMLSCHDALLLGQGHSGVSHAVAWNHRRRLIYDPSGTRYNLELFGRELVYLLVRVGVEDR